MCKMFRFGLIAALTLLSGTALAGVEGRTREETFNIAIPWQSFVAEFNSDGNSRDTSPVINVHPFNPALGSLVSSTVTTVYLGYPFLAKYEVEGAGPSMTFSEDLTTQVKLILNGSVADTQTIGPLHLAGSCSGPAEDILDCQATEKQSAFDMSSADIANDSMAPTVQFGYTLQVSDENCVAAGGTSACISGGSDVTDLKNIDDPRWRATASLTYTYIPSGKPVPEPTMLGALGVAVGALALVRRRRRTA